MHIGLSHNLLTFQLLTFHFILIPITSCIGRDNEMHTFLEELHNIEEKRLGGTHVPFIFIQGEPGIGKTRFLDAAIEEALKDKDR